MRIRAGEENVMTRETEPPTVLVVDDEAMVCRSVEKILTRSGYRVQAAGSVPAALKVLGLGHRVDLVLADLMMPGVSGMELLRTAAERWPALPIVVITGYASVASAVEATRLGAVDYLAKPFTPDELEATVANAIVRGPWRPAPPQKPAPAPPKAEPEKRERDDGDVIDVDMPFDREEVARATSPAYVEQLTRSDMPRLDFCQLGQRSCKRVATRGVCQKPECPIVTAERTRAARAGRVVPIDDQIDVDLPFSAREVAAITGEGYVRALGRGDVPVTGRWPRDVKRRRRVLAVDDEAVVVQAIRRSLDGRGFRVDEAFSGQAALARVATQVYDLVLLDMRMPDLDGLDLLPRIRERQQGVPVVIITGYASIDTAVEAIQRGAADYLAKPFTPDELRSTADRIIRAASPAA
jgi:CheY-like chemotaxis protein